MLATPVPASEAVEASATDGPPTVVFAAGCVSAPVGPVLSIVIVLTSLPWLPPPSVAVTRRSYAPSARAPDPQANVNGEGAPAVPRVVQVPAPLGLIV
jgi:hypothetical protein